MNKENLKKVAEALLSGAYKPVPAARALRMATIENRSHFVGYSVLGVMADTYLGQFESRPRWESPHWESAGALDSPDSFVVYLPIVKFEDERVAEHWKLDLPKEVLDWYGLTREQASNYVVAQMRGFSFEQIGKAILKAIGERKIA